MRRFALAAFLLMVCACAGLHADDLKTAERQWLQGRHLRAQQSYEKLLKDPKVESPACIGISRTLESRGQYDQALTTIEDLLKKKPRDADLLGRKAELQYLRGRWNDALKTAEAAIKEKPKQFNARWVIAQVYRDQGEIKKAVAAFQWFIKAYNEEDVTDPEALVLIGKATAENARWYNLSDQFELVLQDLYADALKANKEYWPADYEAGMLLLEKYNRGEALDALDSALLINETAAKPLVGRGVAALQRMEFEDAGKFADRALKENPSLTAARRLKADVYLGSGNYAKALEELEKARKFNPREESTLGRIALCYLLTNRQKDYDALVKEVEQHDKAPGEFFLTLGTGMDDRRRFSQAESFLKKAIKLRPFLPTALGHLGLLRARLGDETEAERILKKAYEADPFNVRVANMRKVLRHLGKYETIKTKHFLIRYDPANDKALARYLETYLEELYEDLATQFQHRPAGPILIEVFNNHQMFSGRVVALPDLHTIGACTGRIVAMASPHGKGIAKPFNWGRVMRHELVHIFNLDQTNFLVPHWFTEGLAVMNEGFPRPQQWNDLLKDRVPKDNLFNLDTIDLGFMRPRSALDWSMAYCQSLLYVEHLKMKHGDKAVGEMLNAFRDGLSTTAAVEKVCKVDKAAFEKGYRDYLSKVTAEIKGRPLPKQMTLSELETASKNDPDNLDLKAQLGEKYLQRRKRAEARKTAEEVLKKNDKHPVACCVLAQLEALGGNADRARELLEKARNDQNPEPKVLKALGKIYYDTEKLDKAVEIFELGHATEPYENSWLLSLARVHALRKDRKKQIEVLIKLVPTDAEDLDHRKRLARMLNEEKRHAEGEKFAREAIEIDVKDAEAKKELFAALRGQGKNAEADRLEDVLK